LIIVLIVNNFVLVQDQHGGRTIVEMLREENSWIGFPLLEPKFAFNIGQ